ncbi:uncharacterized protein BDZ99DRAFT_541746 [Mytilinidion resinicola]|uniref:Transcription factor domain-containing protein n=1 Tax=Mytilinidion resinicola TaxID=574789 RepID=A0A6A6Z6D4_9PEZI|nr:uncharacterized protein BDZ99DRAFT_541746 [Mytilinidion resinicola]KAF2815827.1 hypothetical protein BDZ99DRAFT_541746 [Mytilinidion resinicola]
MASGSDPDQRRKRSGRKRLPPVAPGPPLQFVTATHPDDFKADSTMRNIRSHVMYKHHSHDAQQTPKSRPSTPSSTRRKSSTPSNDSKSESSDWAKKPQSSQSIDPMELFAFEWGRDGSQFVHMYVNNDNPSAVDLHQRLIAAILGPCRDFVIRTAGPSWMESIFNSYLAFLSHACVVSVYQDVSNHCLDDSPITAYTKTRVIREINERLQNHSTQTDDSTIITIIHLIVMNLSIFRARVPNGMYLQYMSTRSEPASRAIPLPESPIYCPTSHLFTNSRSPECSDHTYGILCDMVNLTNLAIMCTSSNSTPFQGSDMASYETSIHQIYTRLLLRPSARDENLETSQDWIYETCRLASLIYCRAIVHCVTISESAKAMHAHSPGLDANVARELTPTYSAGTVLDALVSAFEMTDTTNCWRTMPGVFLWICLVGGAAAWIPAAHDLPTVNPSAREWQRKAFASHATKCSIMIAFQYPNALLQAQRTMLKIQSLVTRPVASSSFDDPNFGDSQGIHPHLYLPQEHRHAQWEPPRQSLMLPPQPRSGSDLRYVAERAHLEDATDD